MQIEIFALVHTLVKYSDKIKLYNDVHISQKKKKINISKLFLKYVDDVLVMWTKKISNIIVYQVCAVYMFEYNIWSIIQIQGFPIYIYLKEYIIYVSMLKQHRTPHYNVCLMNVCSIHYR